MRKLSFLFLFITSSLYISSQEFNEAYMESLPEAECLDIIKVFQEALGVETKLNEKPAFFYELDGIKQTVSTG